MARTVEECEEIIDFLYKKIGILEQIDEVKDETIAILKKIVEVNEELLRINRIINAKENGEYEK